MRREKMKGRAMMSVAAATLATAAFGTTIVDTFESGTDDWSGDGEVATEKPTAPTGYGYPTTAEHTQTLAVAGTVTRDTTSVSDANVIDMMVKVTRPDETPAETDYNSDSPQFAMYSTQTGELMLYCKQAEDAENATSVSLGQCAENEWVRLTIAVDSNGGMVVAKNGVLIGSTYYLANTPQASGIASVNVIGTTSIDDFVAKNGSYEPYAQVTSEGTAATTDGIPSAYMTRYGKSSASEQIANSSLTVGQAYAAGVAPVEGATFAIEEASYDGDNLTLTFPGEWPAGSYTVKYGNTAECNTTATPTTVAKTGSGNQVTIPIDFTDSNVFYYKVER